MDAEHHLLDAVLAVSSDLDLAAVLERTVREAADLVGAKYVALGVLDASGSHLVAFHTTGVDDATRAAIGDLPRGLGLLGRLIVDPEPLRVDDLHTHPDRYGFPPNHPRMTSFLGVPIVLRERIFGNLYLCDKVAGGTFTGDDERVVVSLARAAALAIDNARMHARLADLALVEDRERIARDLHDSVIQRLFAAGLTLQGVVRRTADPEIQERLAQTVDDLDETIRAIRSTIFELHTVRLGSASTRKEVLEVCLESTRALGFEPAVVFEGPVDTLVTGDVAVDVVTVLREALANVARHAAARHAEVRLTVGADTVSLVVQDDGKGLDDQRAFGSGVANMQERAARRGGTCTLAGTGAGTRLTWSCALTT